MPTPVNGVLVLIASPGDARDERVVVRDKLNDWSVTTGARQGVVLLPWLYERHAVASLGGRPQALINAQAVDLADVVVAFFDARLGTDTGVDVSGTAEEIKRAAELGKPVHVYFSQEPLPRDADLEQLRALKVFKTELSDKGLLGDYSDPDDLAAQIERAIQADIYEQGWGEVSGSSPRAGADPRWEHVRETYPHTDSSGRLKERVRRHALVVLNNATTDAENLTFEVTNADGSDDEPWRFDGPAEPFTLHGDGEREWTFIPLQRATLQVHAHWTESGQARERTVTVVTK